VAAAYQKFFAPATSQSREFGRIELGNLAAGFAIERLQPKIVHIVFPAYGVHNRLVVRSKLRSTVGYSDTRIGGNNQRRRGEGIGVNDRYSALVGVGRFIHHGSVLCHHPAVARDTAEWKSGRAWYSGGRQKLRSPTFERNAHPSVALTFVVVDPLALRRA
jgi:hypothetical protein